MSTGAYPLMDLAIRYGVDYGDILTWAEYLRRCRRGERIGGARFHELSQVCLRIGRQLPATYDLLLDEMVDLADRRWGRERHYVPALAL